MLMKLQKYAGYYPQIQSNFYRKNYGKILKMGRFFLTKLDFYNKKFI